MLKDIRPASDRSLLVSFGDEISVESYGAVMQLTRALEGARGILNLHPAYASVLVDFDPRLRTHEQIESLVRESLGRPSAAVAEEARTVEIPVRYGGEFGPDLEDVARHTGMAAERVVELFGAAEYLVYFVGFATCFRRRACIRWHRRVAGAWWAARRCDCSIRKARRRLCCAWVTACAF